MHHFDFTPYRRSTVGFDRLFEILESSATRTAKQSENYPPFNIERLNEDQYRITLAIAGFRKENINITAQQNLLIVSSKREGDNDDARNFLHVGIASRNFERRFELADYVRVTSAELEDGLLNIDLIHEIPDTMKPRTIEIGSKNSLTNIESEMASKEDKEAA